MLHPWRDFCCGGGAMSILGAAGTRAARTAELWWLMLGLGLAVYLVVLVSLALALAAGPRGRLALTERARMWLVIGGGALGPAVVLLILAFANLRTLIAVAAPSATPDLTLDVIGHQWWWEVRYPDQGFSTANEIHIPSGRVVLVHLTSVDVIHSFFVPRLAGKTDLNPGMSTSMWFDADVPGQYRGQCAEYCGIQHARMALTVFAEDAGQFAAWVATQQQPAAPPSDPTLARGAQAFASLGCIGCHALRYGGTSAVGGDVGPDLTHLAGRTTIAAGTLPNTVDALARWITNPQAEKQGTPMPPTQTDPDTLRALAAYLSSLR